MRPSPIVTMDVLVGGLRPFKCASSTPGGRDRGAGTLRRRLLLRQSGLDQGFAESRRRVDKARLARVNHATESLGFNFIASASAAFASGALSAAE